MASSHLSMMMGFGCNAAGVISTRIIDSPRERLIAIITNNFALCNGRWPTQILIATIIYWCAWFHLTWPGSYPPWQSLESPCLACCSHSLISFGLSRSVLQGEVSTFSLELPPYRPPRFLANDLYIVHRSYIPRAVAGDSLCYPGRSRHLAGRQYHH